MDGRFINSRYVLIPLSSLLVPFTAIDSHRGNVVSHPASRISKPNNRSALVKLIFWILDFGFFSFELTCIIR